MPKIKSKKSGPQPLNIILLGDPAAGKQTHAAQLIKKFNMFDLDMGRELRKLANSKNSNREVKTIIAKTHDKGKLTPTKIARKIFKDKITTTPKSKGILFDGNPKMISEAKFVHKLLKQTGRADNVKVLYLHIPLTESIKRMNNRKEYFKGKYSKRPDDNPQALKNRVKYYQINIAEVKKYFDKIYGLRAVSSMGPYKQVEKRIEKALNEPVKNATRNK